MSEAIYDIPVRKISGEESTLDEYRGKVQLIVNVASKCGFTPQYEGLEKLFERLGDRGFQVLGFPANDFLGQEPGSNEEIRQFCATNYQVQFPLFSKITVTGPEKHPLYRYLIAEMPQAQGRPEMEENLRGYKIEPTKAPEVVWNFEKFLVGRNGHVVGRFCPNIAPDDPRLTQAIETELDKLG